MKLIIVAGMPGAGKEEFLTSMRNLGLPFLRMGDLVREYHSATFPENGNCEIKGFKITGPMKDGKPVDAVPTVGQFANSEREEHGFDIWAKRAMERMSGDVFVIDGCRSLDEINAYKSLTDDVVLIGIHSSPATRYERLVKRGRDDAPKNKEEFAARDTREIGWGLAETIVMSDILLVNEGTLQEFWGLSAETARRLVG